MVMIGVQQNTIACNIMNVNGFEKLNRLDTTM